MATAWVKFAALSMRLHRSLINVVLQVVGWMVLLWGLWTRSWVILVIGGIIEVAGHLFPAPKKPMKPLERFFDVFGVSPVNYVFQYVGAAFCAWGFWRHSLFLIGIGVGIAVLGLIRAVCLGRSKIRAS